MGVYMSIPHVQTPILLRRYINAVRACTTRVLGSPFHTLILVIRIHHGLQFAFERFWLVCMDWTGCKWLQMMVWHGKTNGWCTGVVTCHLWRAWNLAHKFPSWSGSWMVNIVMNCMVVNGVNGDIPTKYGLICYSTSNLGSWNSH